MMNYYIKLAFPSRLTFIKRLLGLTEITQSALEARVTVWWPPPAVPWETSCDSQPHFGGWFPFGPRGIPIYELLPSCRFLPSLHYCVSTAPCTVLCVFPIPISLVVALLSSLPLCASAGDFASVYAVSTLSDKTTSSVHAEAGSQTSEQPSHKFQELLTFAVIRPGLRCLGRPWALTRAGGTPADLTKSWNPFVPGQTLAMSHWHAPGFVLPPMPCDAHWGPEHLPSPPFTLIYCSVGWRASGQAKTCLNLLPSCFLSASLRWIGHSLSALVA